MLAKTEIELAPMPKRGHMKTVYKVLQHGPMKQQEIKMATALEKPSLGKCLSNMCYRGIAIYDKHNRRYAIAPLSTYQSRQPNRERQSKNPVRRIGATTITLSPQDRKRVNELMEKKGKNMNEVISLAIKAYARKDRPQKVADIPASIAPQRPWWKFWS